MKITIETTKEHVMEIIDLLIQKGIRQDQCSFRSKTTIQIKDEKDKKRKNTPGGAEER